MNASSKETRSTCPYCGVGCGVIIETGDDEITGVRGDPDHPANFGRLCTKGSTLHLTAKPMLRQQVRALYPELRTERDQPRQQASWDHTLDFLAERFASTIEAHGPDSVAFYISGQLLTEDYYIFNKLAKGLIGTNNVDTNSRLCMSSAVAGYKQTLGADAPPACYEDIDHTDLIFIVGSNTAYAHPILYRRIEDARKKAKDEGRELKVIVADPRRTDTAREADLFLPILPGTDVALFNGMLHICLWEDLIDPAYIAAHTEGFAALKQTLRDYTPKFVAETCGIREEELLTAARWFGQARAALSMYCQGLNQSSSGTYKNAALINLHVATHQIGKPGAGPFSLTGQPNAMGGREVGGMANLLSAHRDLGNAAHRAEVAALWGVADVPDKTGKTAVEMFEAVRQGEIKIIWIVCTNPAQSMPDQASIRAALQKAELVIVQEAYASTATVEYADVLLPATSWGEKEGTVTNSERRISRVRAAIDAPGEAWHDSWIGVEFGRRLEQRMRLNQSAMPSPQPSPADAGEGATPPVDCPLPHQRERVRVRAAELKASAQSTPEGRAGIQATAASDARANLTQGISLFPYQTIEQIWNEHRESTRGRDLDITGLSYAILEQQGPQQWPYVDGASTGKKRLYEDGIFPTASGKAQFVNTPYQPVAEPADARFPFRLNTGRLRDQWHGMSRTGTVPQLFAHASEPCVQLSKRDADRRLFAPGDLVHVTSRRGSQILPVQVSDEVREGQAFIAMHWGSEFVSGRGHKHHPAQFGVNGLTLPSFDAYSKQPELKHAAVKILKAELPHRVVAFGWADADAASALQINLRPLMHRFAFASCVLFGREGNGLGVLFRAADEETIAPELLAELEAHFGIHARAEVLRYDDARRGHSRHIRIEDGRLRAVVLVGDGSAEAWLKDYMESLQSVEQLGRLLLMPGSKAPSGFKSRGRIVCNCLNVSENEIVEELSKLASQPLDARLPDLQARLKCGTQCGSCLPELKRMVASAPQTSATANNASASPVADASQRVIPIVSSH